MCLHLGPDQLLPRKATKDINVVKYLIRADGVELSSPFRSFIYVFNRLYSIEDRIWKREAEDYTVFGGLKLRGFHSFKQDLKKGYFAGLGWALEGMPQPYKAVIPAGTEYFEGVDDWGTPSYCSQHIKIIGPIEEHSNFENQSDAESTAEDSQRDQSEAGT